jgi:hypothetical protein
MPGKELRLIVFVAEKYLLNADDFGDYIEEQKRQGRKGKKNKKGDYTRKNLEYLAKERLGILTGKEKDDEVVE